MRPGARGLSHADSLEKGFASGPDDPAPDGQSGGLVAVEPVTSPLGEICRSLPATWSDLVPSPIFLLYAA